MRIAERAQTVILHTDSVHCQGSVGQINGEVLYPHLLVIGYYLKAQFLQLKAGVLLFNTHSLNGGIDRVALKRLQ